MAGLCSGVAVVTARRADGEPCGLVATSVSSYSADPPSVLVCIGHASRCHEALVDGEWFGMHLLAADQEAVANTFADALLEDKFSEFRWEWDEDVPAIGGVVSYLRCRRAARFDLYDHSVLVGNVASGRHDGGDPLVYMDRRMNWRLEPRPPGT
jgi:3-hydroxy-9,10-secoandrosta-1,3,5(10)-triene-9,17-dione monooxygenase reductase component